MARLTEAQINEKFEACVNVIISAQPFYKNSSGSAKDFIETTIGAAIFYLPGARCWSGMISESLANNPSLKKVVEHEYPRKISAKNLLAVNWENVDNPVEELKNLYYTKYGRFNYVTKEENSKLRVFQKGGIFTTPKESYAKCNIQLVKG
jgi:hypothetical protein